MATPGTAISRGRTVQRISVVSSTWLSIFDVTPIFMTRLVEESGASITGGLATDGRCPASVVRRSWTSWRASIKSVPSRKITTTDDRPRTLLDRSVFSSLTPFSAFSTGTVTRLSTSAVDRPGASVWISTSGGANSGKTSRGVCVAVRTPTMRSRTARAAATTRRRRAAATRRRITYFPAPNSVPNNSATPTVTTCAPGSAPRARTTAVPTVRATSTRWRK